MFLLNSLSRITRGNRSKRHQNLSDASSSSGSFSKKSSTSQLVRTGSPSVEPTALYLQQPFVRTHLVKGNFSTIVSLPRFVDLDEWVALNGMLLCFLQFRVSRRMMEVLVTGQVFLNLTKALSLSSFSFEGRFLTDYFARFL